MVTSGLLALGAAAAYALATVLQQEAAAEVSARHALRPGLLAQLLRRRRWLTGRAVEVVALGLQTLAVAHGSLLVVQPLLAVGLVFAIAIGAFRTRRRPGTRTLVTAGVLVAAVAAFLVAGRPTAGRAAGSLADWTLGFALLGGAAVVLVAAARLAPSPGRRSALLAAAGACVYSCSGGLLKQSTAVFRAGGLGHLVTSPAGWGFLGVGLVGTVLVQSAFQVGELPATVTALTATEPLAGGIVGALVFGERLAAGPLGRLVVAVAAAAMVASIASAARPEAPSRPDDRRAPRRGRARTPAPTFPARSPGKVSQVPG
jgi:drug/metabolite transporter (DMT)-like permease